MAPNSVEGHFIYEVFDLISQGKNILLLFLSR
jgi:hypothetical protein